MLRLPHPIARTAPIAREERRLEVPEERSVRAREPALDTAEVCSLSADGLGERMEWIRREILPRTLETLRLEHGLAFELESAPGVAEKLDRLIALERACCPGLAFERAAGARPGRLRLVVRGIDPDAPVLRGLGVSDAPPPRSRRLARAAGTGLAASLFVCCVLPIALAALLGGLAPPALARLDGPIPIAGGALIAGAVAWWRLGRRDASGRAIGKGSGAACGPGC
jgi:hypothetical protein